MRERHSFWNGSLTNTALAAFMDGDFDRAATLSAQSVSLFSKLQGGPSLGEALLTRGRINAAQGRIAQARQDLAVALRLAWAEGPRWLFAASLEALGESIVQRNAVHAVRLLGVAARLRREMGAPRRVTDDAAYERALVTLHTQLGRQRVNNIWTEMATMPLDQTIEEAMTYSLPEAEGTQIFERGVAHHLKDSHVDWDDALDVPNFYGREAEQILLAEWIVKDQCRVVSMLGMGGIGKSALATTVMHQVAEQFDAVIWRSLRDSPTCEMLVDGCLQALVPQALAEVNTPFERRLERLMEQLRVQRVLLVLDNAEMLLEGATAGEMRPGFEAYARLLRQIGETKHQSCLLLTSREKPAVLAPLEGRSSPVRAMQLAGLAEGAATQLLDEKKVTCSAVERARLVELYQGNPLALKIVAQTIVDVFGGVIAPFFEQGDVIFGGVRDLLNEQFIRLSALEQTVVLWLAVLREPVSLQDLLAVLRVPPTAGQVLEAVESLRRRSLIEQGQRVGSFTLQSVVLEYATARLIAEASREIVQGQLIRVLEHGMCPADAKEYVRQTQEQVLVAPLLALLQSTYQEQADIQAHLLGLLDRLRGQGQTAQGYGPANLIVLLRTLRGHLRNLDLSRLALRGVFLQGTDMQDTTLVNATVQSTIFTEPFDSVMMVAMSRTGHYWAAATRRGEVQIWGEGGRLLRHAWRAHTENAWALAFSPDERVLASASANDIKLWDVGSGALIWQSWLVKGFLWLEFSPVDQMFASAGTDGIGQSEQGAAGAYWLDYQFDFYSRQPYAHKW